LEATFADGVLQNMTGYPYKMNFSK
jgi:hypothetical protein